MNSFLFRTRITQVELLGRTAKNLRQLLEGIERTAPSSIYHHTHRFLEQHRNFSPEHPNDFAYWINTSLGIKKLGEEISSVDIFRFTDIEDLRSAFVEILKDYLSKRPPLRNCLPGEEFRFLSSRIFALNTPFAAKDLEDFIDCLQKVTIHSLYFHVFEARMRLKQPDNDFSLWLRDGGYKELADDISRLDPYSYTLEGLRSQIINLVKKYINEPR